MMNNTLTPPSSSPADSYVNRRSKELLDRYTGTRGRRQKMAEHLLEASQYQLMLVKFKKHKLALVSLWLLLAMYIVAIFADFVDTYGINTRFPDLVYATPTRIHIRDVQGNYHAPFIYPRVSQLD